MQALNILVIYKVPLPVIEMPVRKTKQSDNIMLEIHIWHNFTGLDYARSPWCQSVYSDMSVLLAFSSVSGLKLRRSSAKNFTSCHY